MLLDMFLHGLIKITEPLVYKGGSLPAPKQEDEVMSNKKGTKLSRNRVKCLECGTVLESLSVHDYRTCECPNRAMVDGGLEYERYGAKDMKKLKTMFEYVPKDTFMWGVLDIETMETHKKPLDDLDDSHIQNIALHLRTRSLPPDRNEHRLTELEKNGRDYMIRRLLGDAKILEDHILPELEKRGLKEVEEEIPWK